MKEDLKENDTIIYSNKIMKDWWLVIHASCKFLLIADYHRYRYFFYQIQYT